MWIMVLLIKLTDFWFNICIADCFDNFILFIYFFLFFYFFIYLFIHDRQISIFYRLYIRLGNIKYSSLIINSMIFYIYNFKVIVNGKNIVAFPDNNLVSTFENLVYRYFFLFPDFWNFLPRGKKLTRGLKISKVQIIFSNG